MKRGRRILFVIVGMIAVAVLLWMAWPQEPEPAYKGKKLSEWITLYDKSLRTEGNGGLDTQAAQHAVVGFGIGAVPTLLRWLDYEPPQWKRRLASLPGPFGFSASLRRLLLGPAEARAELAARGFELLESRGELRGLRLAVLALVQRVNSKQPVSRRAALVLAKFYGSASSDMDYMDSLRLIWKLSDCLKDKDPEVACAAATALGGLVVLDSITGEPYPAYPYWIKDASRGESGIYPEAASALTNGLSHPHPEVRRASAEALGHFKSAGRRAVPALTIALKASDGELRCAATNALLQIAPEALTNGVANGEDHGTKAQRN